MLQFHEFGIEINPKKFIIRYQWKKYGCYTMLVTIAGLFFSYTLEYGNIGLKEQFILNISIVYLELAYTTMTLLVTLLYEDIYVKLFSMNEFFM